jgi:MOSC domain-containing protein YiiM
MSLREVGQVLAIAVRSAVRGPMREVLEAQATAGGGLDGDVKVSPDRGLTLVASNQWKAVQRELDADLPWHTRRANLLIHCDGLGNLIGCTLRIGQVRLKVTGETRPCGLMDELHAGLRAALRPDCRGGVHGRVVKGGVVRIGDVVTVEDDGAAAGVASGE